MHCLWCFCVWSLFCNAVLEFPFYSFVIILLRKKESWMLYVNCCLVHVIALCLFLTVLWIGLWSVIVAFPGLTHFLSNRGKSNSLCQTGKHKKNPLCIVVGQGNSTLRSILGHVAQSVTCLIANPGATSLILIRSHTFVKIDREIIHMVILLPSVEVKVCT